MIQKIFISKRVSLKTYENPYIPSIKNSCVIKIGCNDVFENENT